MKKKKEREHFNLQRPSARMGYGLKNNEKTIEFLHEAAREFLARHFLCLLTLPVHIVSSNPQSNYRRQAMASRCLFLVVLTRHLFIVNSFTEDIPFEV